MVLESTNDLKWYLSNYICITHEVQVGPAIGPAASVTRSSKGWEFHFLLKNQRQSNGFCIFRGPDLVDPAVDPATSVTLIYLSIYT